MSLFTRHLSILYPIYQMDIYHMDEGNIEHVKHTILKL